MPVADTQYDDTYDSAYEGVVTDPKFPDSTDPQPIPIAMRRIHRLFQLETPSELALVPCDTGSRAARDALHSRFREFDSAKFRNLDDATAYLTLLEEIFPHISGEVADLKTELLEIFPPIVRTHNPLLDRPRIDKDKDLLQKFGLKLQQTRLSAELFAALGQEFGQHHDEVDIHTSAEVFWNRLVAEYSVRLGSKKAESLSRWKAAFLREAIDNNPNAVLSHCVDASNQPTVDKAFYGRLILKPFQTDSEYYVWDERREQYVGPMARGSVRRFFQSASPNLAMLHPTLFTPQTTKENTILYTSGNMRSFDSLCDLTMSSVGSIIFRAGEEDSRFDEKSGELIVGVAQFREIAPEYDPKIETWLRLMAGGMSDRLLDWLATFRRLKHPTCAVYLQGRKASGKSMLAEGLSYLFRSGICVPYSQLLSDFNESLKLSFLVHAEEGLSNKDHKRMPSAIFRQLITSDKQEVNSKGRTKMHFRGCLRLIISANNEGGLSLARELLEEADLEAISERILLINPPDDMAEATDYLKKLGGRSVTDAWVEGGGIARHVVWHEQNRQVDLGTRLLVSGEGSGSSRLVVGSDRSRVIQTLLDVCGAQPRPDWVRIVKGNLRFVTRNLLDILNNDPHNSKNAPPLTTRNLGTILSSFEGMGRQKLTVRGEAVNAIELPGRDFLLYLQANPQALADSRSEKVLAVLTAGGDL